MSQRSQASSNSGGQPPNESEVWAEVAGIRKGRIYGLGTESANHLPQRRFRGSGSTSTELVREVENLKVEKAELTDRLEATTNRLDDTTKRLDATEQRVEELMRFMMSSMGQQLPQPPQQPQQPPPHEHGEDEDGDDEDIDNFLL